MKLRMPSVKPVNTYEEAANLFNASSERRPGTSGSGTHKLPGHEASFTGLSKVGTDIQFHYHDTVVVTAHHDGAATFDLSYQSQSTAGFANRFRISSRRGDNYYYIYDEGRLVHTHLGYYRVGPSGLITIKDGNVANPERDTIPFERRRTNRKKANAAMKESGAAEFIEWYKAMSAVLNDPRRQHTEGTSVHNVLGMIADRDQWNTLLRTSRFGYRIAPPTFLAKLRELVADNYGCHYTETFATAPNYILAMKRKRNV